MFFPVIPEASYENSFPVHSVLVALKCATTVHFLSFNALSHSSHPSHPLRLDFHNITESDLSLFVEMVPFHVISLCKPSVGKRDIHSVGKKTTQSDNESQDLAPNIGGNKVPMIVPECESMWGSLRL